MREAKGDYNTLGLVFLFRRVIRVNNSIGLIHIAVNPEKINDRAKPLVIPEVSEAINSDNSAVAVL